MVGINMDDVINVLNLIRVHLIAAGVILVLGIIVVRNGTDARLITYDVGSNYLTDTESAASVIAMRNAVHHILYTVVNSRAYSEENMNRGMESWKMAFIGADVVLAALAVLLEVTVVRKGYRKRKDL